MEEADNKNEPHRFLNKHVISQAANLILCTPQKDIKQKDVANKQKSVGVNLCYSSHS